MMQQHTIGKFCLSIQLPSREDAFSLQNRLGADCKTALAPLMGELFDEWTDPDTLLQIDKLEIDLGSCSRETLQRDLPEMIMAYLRKHYPAMKQQAALAEGMERIPLTQGYFQSWLYFLEHGTLPVTAGRWEQAAWEEGILATISTEVHALRQCRELLVDCAQALPRLLYQFSRNFIRNWILAFSGGVYREAITLVTEWEELYNSAVVSPEKVRRFIPAQSVVLPGKDTLYLSVTTMLIKELVLPGVKAENVVLLEKLLQVTFGRAYFIHGLHVVRQSVATEKSAPALLQGTLDLLSGKYREVLAVFPSSVSFTEEKRGKGPSSVEEDVPAEKEKRTGPDLAEEDTRVSSTKKNTEEISSAENKVENEQVTSSSVTADTNTSVPAPEEGTQLYIGNAGLILLHPYLRILFEELLLLHEDVFKDEDAVSRAVQLLGYLAYGENDIPEYDLLFPKLLCGLMPAQPVKRFITLTDVEKAEADTLLQAVINNWGGLGETSPDGLRGNFLLREGRLEWRNEEWQLYVTQQAYDMLLNRLPWGFSVVGLSWMPWLIKTVWT